jgi:hypothetical protein
MASLFTRFSRSHTTTHHSRWDSSGRVISSSQRPLPDNTQQTNIHAPGGIRAHNLSRRAAADLRLRPHGHWDRPGILNTTENFEKQIVLYPQSENVYHTACPTRYRTRHFFNNFTTNEDIATKFVADLPHCVRNVKEKNVYLLKFRCNIFIGVRIITEMPVSVTSGTLCTWAKLKSILLTSQNEEVTSQL